MLQLTDISKLISEKDIDPQISEYLTLGLARRLGFTQKEICTHMDISQKKHSQILATYQQATRTYSNASMQELSDPQDTLKSIVLNINILEKEIGIGEPKHHQIFSGFPGAEI